MHRLSRTHEGWVHRQAALVEQLRDMAVPAAMFTETMQKNDAAARARRRQQIVRHEEAVPRAA